jgi:hypothetical protein
MGFSPVKDVVFREAIDNPGRLANVPALPGRTDQDITLHLYINIKRRSIQSRELLRIENSFTA